MSNWNRNYRSPWERAIGFIPLVHCKNTDYAAFFNQLKNLKNMTMILPMQTRKSNSVHHGCFTYCTLLKMRDKVGSFASAGNVEAFLGCHSMYYLMTVLLKKQKLITWSVCKSCRRSCSTRSPVVFLRPHFQLDELSVSLSLSYLSPQINQGQLKNNLK